MAELPARCVPDPGVVLKWLLPEPDAGRALLLRDHVWQARGELLAPAYWRTELANALAKRVARGGIERSEADTVLGAAALLPITDVSDASLRPLAWEIALGAGVTVYRALYAALAQRAGAPLVTADARLAERLRAWREDFPVLVLGEL